jgi:SAM-dependent methyltransferase
LDSFLKLETEKLTRSWTRHDPGMLRDYLVAGVEDPRINLQSIFSRHFLAHGLKLDRLFPLMDHECRFSAVMNWLVALAGQTTDAAEFETILYALKRGADNVEGLEIPRFVLQTFAGLPAVVGEITIPNYVETFLSGTQFPDGKPNLHQPSFDTFGQLWRELLSSQPINPQPLSVFEPACGSANDYRFLDRYGLARLLDYSGFDLCSANVENARALFPGVRFEVGNAFEIAAPDKAFDLCFVHDLFEHLSLPGLEIAVREICRVTRLGICAGFFNMDEIPEHRERPVDEYHWNTLSMARMKALFARHGFAAQVRHVGTFLRQRIGCDQTHNSNAYTFILLPAATRPHSTNPSAPVIFLA